jgi:hypothetical protein
MVRVSLKSFMLVVGFLAVAGVSNPALAQTKAPPKLQAALILKLLAFYTNLGGDPFTIHVIGAPDVAAELKSLIGKPAGKASLNSVTEGDIGSAGGAKVVYVGSGVSAAIAHTQSNSILSVTGEPSFVPDGVTLGVGIEDGKPKIILNLSSSKAENINWNPAILKVAATIK